MLGVATLEDGQIETGTLVGHPDHDLRKLQASFLRAKFADALSQSRARVAPAGEDFGGKKVVDPEHVGCRGGVVDND